MAKPTLRLRDWLFEGENPADANTQTPLRAVVAPEQGQEDWSALFADEPGPQPLESEEGLFSPEPQSDRDNPSQQHTVQDWDAGIAAHPQTSQTPPPLFDAPTSRAPSRREPPPIVAAPVEQPIFQASPTATHKPEAPLKTAAVIPHPFGLPETLFGGTSPHDDAAEVPTVEPAAPRRTTLFGSAPAQVEPQQSSPPQVPPPAPSAVVLPPIPETPEEQALAIWEIVGPEGLPHSIEGLVSAFAQQLIALLLAIHRGEIIPHGAFLPVVDQLLSLLEKQPDQIQTLEQILLENPIEKLALPPVQGENDRAIMEDLTLHLLNVTFYVYKVGMEVLDPHSLRLAVRAAAIHDLGMARLPVGLLVERGVFSQQQREMMQLHPLETQDLVRTIYPDEPELAALVVQEQERFNGSGYPAHLTGEAIHPAARLIGLIDTFEAMIHPRPYRKRLLPVEAVQRIVRELKGVFDPRQVKGLINNISVFPMGTYVQLNTKEVGRVVQTYRDSPLRPRIEVRYNEAKQKLSIPRTIDLSKTPLIFITKSLYAEDVEESIRGG
ncbi:MAG: hypothetical protein COX57_12090 [Alphaproteobacteria bacterium CG_4_10_14_0_2_um_filter_63_37]|nr:MAG: hypothetical protein COX57_12090 [Alphaproteobacteria bacterium CG_4_10_14_0_2_um_filter_63_37]